jgi:hypothetical protein
MNATIAAKRRRRPVQHNAADLLEVITISPRTARQPLVVGRWEMIPIRHNTMLEDKTRHYFDVERFIERGNLAEHLFQLEYKGTAPTELQRSLCLEIGLEHFRPGCRGQNVELPKFDRAGVFSALSHQATCRLFGRYCNEHRFHQLTVCCPRGEFTRYRFGHRPGVATSSA